jgi:hypothetical protein
MRSYRMPVLHKRRERRNLIKVLTDEQQQFILEHRRPQARKKGLLDADSRSAVRTQSPHPGRHAGKQPALMRCRAAE